MRRLPIYAHIAATLALVAAFYAHAVYYRYTELDLGSPYQPMHRHVYFLLLYVFFGTAAVFTATAATTRIRFALHDVCTKVTMSRIWNDDRIWILAGTTLAFLIPASLHTFLLLGARLTDDEPVYRFAAQLLASGRIAGPSPGEHEVFGHIFMVDDGKWYTQYFLGWPALMAPFVKLGAEGFANAFYTALCVFPMYDIARQIQGRGAARVALLIFLLSPMLMIGGATLLAHPSCMTAITWTLWFFLRARKTDSLPLWHAGFAVVFCVAFFIRPQTTVALCLPLVVMWMFHVLRLPNKQRVLNGLAFLVPAAAFAALFLMTNRALTGSAFYTPYQRTVDFVREHGYLHGHIMPAEAYDIVSMTFDLSHAFVMSSTSVFRYNFVALGWPTAFVFLLLTRINLATRPLWAMIAFFALTHFFVSDPGVDSFGTPHFFEVTIPIIILTGIGFSRANRWLRGTDKLSSLAPHLRFLAPSALFGLMIVGASCYAPICAYNVHRIARAVNLPEVLLNQARVHNAVLFAAGATVPHCISAPTRHFVFWPPISDPDLSDDRIWLVHRGLDKDRDVMKTRFPDRRGYLVYWNPECKMMANLVYPPAPPDGSLKGMMMKALPK